jgi:hypothetical protein
MNSPPTVTVVDASGYPSMQFSYPMPQSNSAGVPPVYSMTPEDGVPPPYPAYYAQPGLDFPSVHQVYGTPGYQGPVYAAPVPIILVQRPMPERHPEADACGITSLTAPGPSGAAFYNSYGIPVFDTFKREFPERGCACAPSYRPAKPCVVRYLIENDRNLRDDCRALGMRMLTYQVDRAGYRCFWFLWGWILLFCLGVIICCTSVHSGFGEAVGVLMIVGSLVWGPVALIYWCRMRREERRLGKMETHLNALYSQTNLN